MFQCANCRIADHITALGKRIKREIPCKCQPSHAASNQNIEKGFCDTKVQRLVCIIARLKYNVWF